MGEAFLGCGPAGLIDGQAVLDKVLGGVADVFPVLLGLEFIILDDEIPVSRCSKCDGWLGDVENTYAGDDCLHLLVLRVTIEWGISSEEEVGDDTHSPDVHWLSVSSYNTILLAPQINRSEANRRTFPEDLRGHILHPIAISAHPREESIYQK